jgi:hypothetical protein
MDDHPYGIEMLRHDLARFRSLLSADDRGTDFLHGGRRLLPGY